MFLAKPTHNLEEPNFEIEITQRQRLRRIEMAASPLIELRPELVQRICALQELATEGTNPNEEIETVHTLNQSQTSVETIEPGGFTISLSAEASRSNNRSGVVRFLPEGGSITLPRSDDPDFFGNRARQIRAAREARTRDPNDVGAQREYAERARQLIGDISAMLRDGADSDSEADPEADNLDLVDPEEAASSSVD